MKIDVFLKHVKNQNHWVITDRKRRTKYVWASGMTQKRLSDEFTKWIKESWDVIFLCGDDNSGEDCDNDASMYETTQRGKFLSLQKRLLELIGFTVEEIEWMMDWHIGKRKAMGFQYKQEIPCLPSGAAWTLFMNTIGLIVFQTQVWEVKQALTGKEGVFDYVSLAAQLLGLEMKSIPALRIADNSFSGTEFLKGIVVRGKKRVYWVPCPGRIGKCSSLIVNSENKKKALLKKPEMLRAHFKSVAKGLENHVLDPLLRIWVDHWVQSSGEAKSHATYNSVYSNIWSSEKQILVLDDEDAANWGRIWEEVMETRYDISREEYRAMREQLINHVDDFGTFEGLGWSKLFRRDYLGSVTG
jgi:hypothetical protein